MGKSTRVQIWTLVQNLPIAERWNEGSPLLCAYQDRVPLHRHEVQRRGTRQVGAARHGHPVMSVPVPVASSMKISGHPISANWLN